MTRGDAVWKIRRPDSVDGFDGRGWMTAAHGEVGDTERRVWTSDAVEHHYDAATFARVPPGQATDAASRLGELKTGSISRLDG